MKIDIIPAIITYVVWCLLSYLTCSFYHWTFIAKDWEQETRNYMIMFGPIFGVFIFLAVAFYRDAFSEENSL